MVFLFSKYGQVHAAQPQSRREFPLADTGTAKIDVYYVVFKLDKCLAGTRIFVEVLNRDMADYMNSIVRFVFPLGNMLPCPPRRIPDSARSDMV